MCDCTVRDVERLDATPKHSTIKLLNSWYKDNSGYDEENWPKIKKVIEENRSSYRRKFND